MSNHRAYIDAAEIARQQAVSPLSLGRQKEPLLTKRRRETPHDLGEPDEENVTLEFQPRNSLRAILDWEIPDQWPLIPGWALSRLIAWAFFDQQESKLETGVAERPLEPNYAYKAGQLYLLYHIDSLWRDYEASTSLSKPPPERLWTAIHTFLQTGEKRDGFGLAGETLSALHHKTHRDLTVVYHVMDFLVRADGAKRRRRDLFTVELARHFVDKFEPTGEHLGKSLIEKIWNRYRDAAPHIYGFYPKMYPTGAADSGSAESKIQTDADWISRVVQLAANTSVEESIGHAAYAADVLAMTRTISVRTSDFYGVPHVTPLWRKFDALEESIIESSDPNGALRD